MEIGKAIRNSKYYLALKTMKYVLWEAWIGGVVRVSNDRYIVTDGLFGTENKYIEKNLFTSYSPFMIMNKEAVETWREEKYSIGEELEGRDY